MEMKWLTNQQNACGKSLNFERNRTGKFILVLTKGKITSGDSIKRYKQK
jgi:MOSC domain-containing protein YiiM